MGMATPSWFDQRQGKTDATGPDVLRLTAPNMREAFITIRRNGDGLYSAALRTSSEGPDLAVTAPEFASADDAWNAAFELYRVHLVV
jgi:hypothetical protein